LDRLREHVGEFLPDPQVVRAEVRGTVQELVSVQRITDSRSLTDHPVIILRAYSHHTAPRIEGLNRFVGGCKTLHVIHGFMPDLAGRGNFIVWQGKPLLLDLNSHHSHIEEKPRRRGAPIQIPVNDQGVPTWDWSMSTLATMETDLLHLPIEEDSFYAPLRDPARQKFLQELTDRYRERIGLDQMC
jgi:hypothetical protein